MVLNLIKFILQRIITDLGNFLREKIDIIE
jgi:hypothetical protein